MTLALPPCAAGALVVLHADAQLLAGREALGPAVGAGQAAGAAGLRRGAGTGGLPRGAAGAPARPRDLGGHGLRPHPAGAAASRTGSSSGGRCARRYVARVAGRVEGEAGGSTLPLACDWPNRPRQMVSTAGKPAVTDWEVVEREPAATRLRARPLTGRSHQLRVHLAALGHPILGDPFYAPPEAFAAAPRLQLHAATLGVSPSARRGAGSSSSGGAVLRAIMQHGRLAGSGHRAGAGRRLPRLDASTRRERLGLRGWVRTSATARWRRCCRARTRGWRRMISAMRRGPPAASGGGAEPEPADVGRRLRGSRSGARARRRRGRRSCRRGRSLPGGC